MTRSPLTIEHALLGFLHQQPLHGYELYQQLTNPAGLWLVWRIKQSQLYALLAKLEDEGYISADVQPQENRPPRKVLRLTPAGLDAYERWLLKPVAHPRSMRQEFLAKFYFARQRDVDTAQRLIEVQRAQCEAWLTAQHRQNQAEAPSFEETVNRFRLSQIQAILTWLDSCEEMLANWSATE
ncbi:MAG: PadR family transcriptional regulator [Chloroflexi bacterium]|nr:MAG: PadR family transcriptional regulator [Chloroflexota bacterium]